MPKGSGRGGASKKPSVPLDLTEDDSNVVFGDSKSIKRGEDSAKDGAKSAQADGDVPKKPDTRKLIGGASWTGKLPMNMLSEHCQKQKWARPEYSVTKLFEGFSSMVTLKATNPKTKEIVTLPSFKLPPSYKHIAVQPTAVEARHFAATFALFRVCSMRNIHTMLPPTYRDLWKNEFQGLKSQDVTDGRGWMYEADPFTAKQEREKAQALMAKKRDEGEKQSAREAEQPVVSLAPNGAKTGTSNRNVMKGWTRVPKIDMGKRTRVKVEDLVRRNAVWNAHGSHISEIQRRNINAEFIDLGFRKSHIEEALEQSKDREEALEWLLIHVPEDDLPKWSLPESYTAGISMANGNLKREAAVKRLAEAGYSVELCAKFFDEYDGDENLAAESLQRTLLSTGTDQANEPETLKLSMEQNLDEDWTWIKEYETLDAIFGNRFTRIASDIYRVQLQVPRTKSNHILDVRKSKLYPQVPPVISIMANDLPAYIRLSITRQVIQHTRENLLGEPMIFNMIDWLENEIPRIVESPGKLGDVFGAAPAHPVKSTTFINGQAEHRQKASPVSWRPNQRQNLDILDQWWTRQDSPQQQKMLAARRSLPAWKLQNAIVEAVSNHQVTIISGETGSGKSTQSVQFILDDAIQRRMGAYVNIICTQPRRISALGLADRVSDERCGSVGDEVGYAIRGESKQKRGTTKITFVTTGVLLRRLQTSGGSQDSIVAALADVTHVVLDEVHERSLDTDFLLVLLKDVLVRRKDLKVILMSATLDARVFEKYFSTASTVGKIEIQGRTFPVEDYYLDDVIRLTGFNTDSRNRIFNDDDVEGVDSNIANTIQSIGMRINYDLIAATVQAIDSLLGAREGGILIFLPGTLEINRSLDAIRRLPKMHPLPLHASLTPVEQRRVFPLAPRGKRKVIAATNVAETSITIEDIVAVIDCGKVKETSFDPQNNMVKLEEVWASRAACQQRRGRAGRVQAGICYKLYTRNAETKMSERPEPEIRRVPLEQLCLSVRAMGVIDVLAFLGSALTPPESLAVEGAIDLLGRMGALDGGDLTALGRHLSMIPADLRCSKLMVYGATFGCLESCLTIAAILTVRSPFLSPQAKRDESKTARTSFAPGQGDLICDLRAYDEWLQRKNTSSHRDVKSWCDQTYLSSQTLNDISSNRSQYLSSLKESGFLPLSYQPTTHTSLNACNTNAALIRALIAGAFNPQLARIDFPDKKFAPSMSGAVELDPEARTIKFWNEDNGRVFVHPSSTLFDAQGFVGESVYLSYFNKMATSKIFVRELTPFNAYSLLLFSGPIALDTMGRGLVVDRWLRLRGWARIGVLISRLRGMLDEILARKIEDPNLDLSGNEVVGVVRKLVEYDGLDR